MWSDRNKDFAPDRSSDPGKEAGMAFEGVGRIGNVAVIGKGMIIRGDIKSQESLHIEGEVEGSLDLSGYRLTIGRDGRVGANATAREIELLGVVRGDLVATSKITIRRGARLVGDLRAPGILIEEGAYVNGKIEIVNTAEPGRFDGTQPPVRKTAAGH